MRNAARRSESASYSLEVGVSGGAKKAEAGPVAGQPPAKIDARRQDDNRVVGIDGNETYLLPDALIHGG